MKANPMSKRESALCIYLERYMNREVVGLLADIVDRAAVQFPTVDPRDIAATVVEALNTDRWALRRSVTAASVSARVMDA